MIECKEKIDTQVQEMRSIRIIKRERRAEESRGVQNARKKRYDTIQYNMISYDTNIYIFNNKQNNVINK